MNLRKLRKDSGGQALVEFALVIPIAIFLLLCIMEGGRIFASYLELESATRDAARYASIYCSPRVVDDAALESWKAATLVPVVASRLSMLSADQVQVTLTRVVANGGKEAWITVVLKYPLDITTPIISSITGNPFNLSATMVMRNEL